MAMGTGESGNSLRGPRGRIRSKSRLRGVRRPRLHLVEPERLEVRALLATIPAAAATAAAAEPLEHDGQRRRRERQHEQLVGGGGPAWIRRSSWRSGRTTTRRWRRSRSTGRSSPWRRRIRLTAARPGWRCSPSPPTPAACRVEPSLLNPATSGPTVPYAYVTNPSLGFDDSGNFYILTEYSTGGAAGAVPSSGALVLQKYNFSGSTPAAVQFTNNEQDPTLYPGFGFFGGATSDLKVIYQWYQLGQRRRGARPHDDGGRQRGDPAAERRRRRRIPTRATSTSRGRPMTSRSIRTRWARISTPTGSRRWSPRTGATTSAR